MSGKMSLANAKSLFLQLTRQTPAPKTSTESPSQARAFLAMREHDDRRLPVSKLKLRPAVQVLQDFRNQLRLAEEMVAKLGFHLRELQVLKTAPRLGRPQSAPQVSSKIQPKAPAKVLIFQAPTPSLMPTNDEPPQDKL